VDGEIVKSHYLSMHSKFEELKEFFMERNTTGGQEIEFVEFSFLLGEFYDGGQLFKWNTIGLWPLLITILNFNPSKRMQFGKGTFDIVFHTKTSGKNK